MCDFRGPPHAVKEIATGTVTEVGEVKNAAGYSTNYNDGIQKKADITEPGMYEISATGSYYSYFDGENWWMSNADWGPPSEKYWQETGGVPSEYLKYEFLRTPENEQVQIHSY